MNVTDLVAAAESIQAPLDPQELADAGSWAVRSVKDIDFSLSCIRESEAELADIDAMEAEAIARVKARAEQMRKAPAGRISFFKGRIAEYAEPNRESLLPGKSKTRTFINGSVGWRKKTGGLVVVDKDALAAWLSTQDPSLFRIKLEPELKALQEQFKTNGVIPPGMEFRSDAEEIVVKAIPLPTLDAVPTRRIA